MFERDMQALMFNIFIPGVICSISKEEERIAIYFRSAKLPSEYGNIELVIWTKLYVSMLYCARPIAPKKYI